MLTRSIARIRLYSPDPLSSLQHGLSPPVPDCRLLLLPEEMFHLLSFLSLSDWGQLCLTSKQMRNLVLCSVISKPRLSRLTGRLSGVTSTQIRMELWLQVCRQFGQFCKRATMLCSSEVRLTILAAWFSDFSQLGC